MKKIGFMAVYNDVDYVDYTLRSFLDFVDEMVVVEGAFDITMAQGKPARSDDGTLQILKKYEQENKITLIHANLREHKFHYDIGYQFAVERGADWAIMVDSDEIWTKQAKVFADSSMKAKMGYEACEIRVDEYCFINDFKTWYMGNYPRIFRCKKGSKFVFDNEVQFSGYQRGKHQICYVPGRNIFHYGYVRAQHRWRLKQDYMYEKDHNPLNLQYKLEGDKYIIPDDIKIFQFTGQHPEIMRSHKFHDKTANEIIYGEV
jgi:glycosyltransferase involved in cell wall biosynthesis